MEQIEDIENYSVPENLAERCPLVVGLLKAAGASLGLL